MKKQELNKQVLIDEIIDNIADKVTSKILKALDKDKAFLTVEEASDFLNLSINTIYSKVCKNELPFIKRGNKLYFSNIELEKYIRHGYASKNINK